MAHAPRDGDPVPGAEHCALTRDDELELTREDGVDLVYAVRVFRKMSARRVDVQADGIPFGLELPPQRLFGEIAIGLRIPVTD